MRISIQYLRDLACVLALLALACAHAMAASGDTTIGLYDKVNVNVVKTSKIETSSTYSACSRAQEENESIVSQRLEQKGKSCSVLTKRQSTSSGPGGVGVSCTIESVLVCQNL